MGSVPVPATMAEALGMIASGMGFVADIDVAGMPTEALAQVLRALEASDAVQTVARGRFLAAFDAADGPVGDGQRTVRAWLVHSTRVTRGQAGEHKAVQALAESHAPLLAGLRERAVTKSAALQLARWTAAIPEEYRDQAEEIVVAAARAGAGLRALAAICAEIRHRTAPPDPTDDDDRYLDRALYLETTIDGAGVIRGDLSPECAAMVTAVLDALSAPQGGGDLRTRPQRYHDALEEAMRRLLASGLLPARAGQPVKALVHIGLPDLLGLDTDSVLLDKWTAEYRARWAAHRAAAAIGPGDGGAWLDGDAARAIACDAMLIPVVTADVDPGAVEELIVLCVQYDRIRGHTHGTTSSPDGTGTEGASTGGTGPHAGDGATTPPGPAAADPRPRPDGASGSGQPSQADVLAILEHQILGTIVRVLSGPGGLASFLRRNLLGKPLAGPSLPLDVGQTDDIPVHLRRLVALRDQGCQFPGGCDQPACGCEAHHVIHRADGGHTSLTNLKDYCWWHHHVMLHQLGWTLTVHPDGTSQATSPRGRVIRSHSPPPDG